MLQTSNMQAPTIDDIRAAARRIEGNVVRTPMHGQPHACPRSSARRSGSSSRTCSSPPHTRSAARSTNCCSSRRKSAHGASSRLQRAIMRRRLPITRSASAFRRRSSCRAATPTVKVTQTEGHGAHVELHGAMFDDAYAKARELALEKGYVFVHPFDDPQIIAGAGTVGARNARGRAASSTRSSFRSAAAA